MTESKALVTSSVDPDVSRAMVMFGRMQPMKDALGCKDLTDPELQLYAMVCVHTGLDPFLKQIHAIKRGGHMVIQTGIDGYRSTAADTKQYRGSDEATYEECDCGDADSPPHHPSVSRVVVHRATPEGGITDQTGVARWHELKPAHYKSEKASDFQDAMWWKMPYNQLSKCAEANGLRKAFPRVLGGVYIHEEMEQANVIEGQATDVTPQPKVQDRVRAAREAAEKPKAEQIEGEVVSDDPPTPNELGFEDYEREYQPPEGATGVEEAVANHPVWGASNDGPAPECPNGHGAMAKSQYGGFWCKTCKAKIKT